MSFTVLVAPTGFKESIEIGNVTRAIATGLKKAVPSLRVLNAPLVGGGNGFTRGLIGATGGAIHKVRVTGPVLRQIDAFFGVTNPKEGKTAIIEVAAAAGTRLIPHDLPEPAMTTSRGVGELILAALDAGVKRILIGCGESGIYDGGAGMAQALGARLYDKAGNEIGAGGTDLARLARIDTSGLDRRLKTVTIDVAVDLHNLLLGPNGVARTLDLHHAVNQSQVTMLEKGLETYADCIRQATGKNIGTAGGSGASGGLGGGLVAFAGAKLHPRSDIVMQFLGFDSLLGEADLVITVEGSLSGKTSSLGAHWEVVRRADARGVPTVVLVGESAGNGSMVSFDQNIDAFVSVIKRPCTLEEAFENGEALFRRAAEDAMGLIAVGARLRSHRPVSCTSP